MRLTHAYHTNSHKQPPLPTPTTTNANHHQRQSLPPISTHVRPLYKNVYTHGYPPTHSHKHSHSCYTKWGTRRTQDRRRKENSHPPPFFPRKHDLQCLLRPPAPTPPLPPGKPKNLHPERIRRRSAPAKPRSARAASWMYQLRAGRTKGREER